MGFLGVGGKKIITSLSKKRKRERKGGKGEKGKGKEGKRKKGMRNEGKRKKKEKDGLWFTQENKQNLLGGKSYFSPKQ